MNIREEIQFLALKKITETKKNPILESFIEAFKEDAKEYGFTKAVEIYSSVYGLNELEHLNENVLPLFEKQMFGVTGAEKYIAPGKANIESWTRAEKKLEGGVSNNLFRNIWQKVKSFSTGQFSSIKKIIETGNWKALLSLPLFKGALAAGGIAAVIAILRKVFKKKITPEQMTKIKEMA